MPGPRPGTSHDREAQEPGDLSDRHVDGGPDFIGQTGLGHVPDHACDEPLRTPCGQATPARRVFTRPQAPRQGLVRPRGRRTRRAIELSVRWPPRHEGDPESLEVSRRDEPDGNELGSLQTRLVDGGRPTRSPQGELLGQANGFRLR